MFVLCSETLLKLQVDVDVELLQQLRGINANSFTLNVYYALTLGQYGLAKKNLIPNAVKICTVYLSRLWFWHGVLTHCVREKEAVNIWQDFAG